MDTRLIRTPCLYLVGFMGSGKTTAGKLLADELGWEFGDLDGDIESQAGRSINSIFEESGEPEFRRLEHEALKRRVRVIQTGRPVVLSLGGGAFAQQDNYELVCENGISLWLDCPIERIQARIAGQQHRPLARDLGQFANLFEARRAAYARADFRIAVDTDDARDIVRAILSLPVF